MENKKTIEISISEAREMYEQGGFARTIAMSAYQEDELKKRLPKSWEEFCEICSINEGNCYITSDSMIKKYEFPGNKRTPNIDRNLFNDKESAEQHLALMQLHQLRDYYRGAWKPDYNKTSTKYCIVNRTGTLIVRDIINFSHFLTFPDEQMARTFMNCFCGLIYKAGDLI